MNSAPAYAASAAQPLSTRVAGAGATYPPAHDHTKRDTLLGAGAGAATGHTLLGGVAGHVVGKHGHERAQEAGVGVGPGTTQPSTLNKILGTVESGVGKLVHNPSMVAQGQAKKAGLQTSNAGGAGGVGY